MPSLLEVHDLSVKYEDRRGDGLAVSGISLKVDRGEIVGIAGESGSGKSTVALAISRLLPETASVSGSVMFLGRNLLTLPKSELRRLRGAELGMVFQDPFSSLNPVLRVGDLLSSVARSQHRLDKHEAAKVVVDALEAAGLEAQVRDRYPGELSGGMCQRVVIAMAIISGASLLVADEPTTALDVTVQARVLDLIQSLRLERGMGCILISHDLAALSVVCDRVIVMYGGEIVEAGILEAVYRRPRHPYTADLLQCAISGRTRPSQRGLRFLGRSETAGPAARQDQDEHGCSYAERCKYVEVACRVGRIELEADSGHLVRCRRANELDRLSESFGAGTAVVNADFGEGRADAE